MVLSTTRVATLFGLLLPYVAAFALPEVPWKESGIWAGRKRQNGYDTGCNYGPQSRGCWTGEFNIDTDMDLNWPNTGKTVKVRSITSPEARAALIFSSITLKLPILPVHQMALKGQCC
jgi:hypothetical protein